VRCRSEECRRSGGRKGRDHEIRGGVCTAFLVLGQGNLVRPGCEMETKRREGKGTLPKGDEKIEVVLKNSL